MSVPEREIEWPSEEALRAYAWWELYGDGPWSLRALQRETLRLLVAEVEKMLAERPEWVTSRRNDLHLFMEDFEGVLYLSQDGNENTGVLE